MLARTGEDFLLAAEPREVFFGDEEAGAGRYVLAFFKVARLAAMTCSGPSAEPLDRSISLEVVDCASLRRVFRVDFSGGENMSSMFSSPRLLRVFSGMVMPVFLRNFSS